VTYDYDLSYVGGIGTTAVQAGPGKSSRPEVKTQCTTTERERDTERERVKEREREIERERKERRKRNIALMVKEEIIHGVQCHREKKNAQSKVTKKLIFLVYTQSV
jgi:hypothetical protein